MVVVAANGIRQHVEGHDAHLDAVPVGQALAGGSDEALRLRLEFAREGLAGFVEFGKKLRCPWM